MGRPGSIKKPVELTKETIRKCSSEQVFLNILQYSQKNTCVEASF